MTTNIEEAIDNVSKHVTHGLTKTRVYKIWSMMKQRCLNKNNPAYHNYGGRGIKICDRWMKFENFYEDMGEPKKGMLLERNDNDSGYCPENCTWETWEKQQNNKRNNRRITFKNKTMTLAQWSKEMGVNRCVLDSRLNALGWSIEKALTTPLLRIRKPNPPKEYE